VRGFYPILRGKRTPRTRHTNILPGDHRPAISDVHYFWGTSDSGDTVGVSVAAPSEPHATTEVHALDLAVRADPKLWPACHRACSALAANPAESHQY
jgi:hypothetical protein